VWGSYLITRRPLLHSPHCYSSTTLCGGVDLDHRGWRTSRPVSTRMGNRFRAEKQSRYVTSCPAQLSLAIPLGIGAVSTTESCGVKQVTPHDTLAQYLGLIFTARLHVMQPSVFAKAFLSICLSFRLSNACIVTKQKKLMSTLLYHMKECLSYFWDTENSWRGTTSYTWNFGPKWPRSSKNADFQSIFARSSSAVTPSEKSSIKTNVKSTTRFPISLRWISYVAPKLPFPKPKRELKKRKTTVFFLKVHFTWRKSATKFLCVKAVRDKVVRHSLAYLSVQKWFTGTSHNTWKFGWNWPTPSKTPISNQYLLVAHQPLHLAKKFNYHERSPLRAFHWV